jgi:hypothetical protein
VPPANALAPRCVTNTNAAKTHADTKHTTVRFEFIFRWEFIFRKFPSDLENSRNRNAFHSAHGIRRRDNDSPAPPNQAIPPIVRLFASMCAFAGRYPHTPARRSQ